MLRYIEVKEVMRNNASIKTYKPIMNNFKQNFEHLEEILKNEKKNVLEKIAYTIDPEKKYYCLDGFIWFKNLKQILNILSQG